MDNRIIHSMDDLIMSLDDYKSEVDSHYGHEFTKEHYDDVIAAFMQGIPPNQVFVGEADKFLNQQKT